MQTYEEWKQTNWDSAHSKQDLSALTGTGLQAHLATLEASHLLLPQSSVLCVGVGTGGWVAEAAEAAQDTWALDVSPVAGLCLPEQVRFITDAGLLPSNHFDVALSLWVAPHMSDHDLQEQLTEVVRAIKPEGVFAIHYKEPLDPHAVLDNRSGAEDEYRRAQSASMLRRRKHFADMVTWAKGRVKLIAAERPSSFYQVVEVSAHVCKCKTTPPR